MTVLPPRPGAEWKGYEVELDVHIVYNHLPPVIRTIAQEDDRMAHHVASHVRKVAIQHAPVRSGRLKNRIRLEPQGNGKINVVSDTSGQGHREYAFYNEYGTRYMHAQPYMTPAAAAGGIAMRTEGIKMGRRVDLSARTGRAI